MTEQDKTRDTHAIEVSEKTRQRYDRKKAEMDAADPNLPDMTDDHFVECLLDTLEAVNDGYYEEQYE